MLVPIAASLLLAQQSAPKPPPKSPDKSLPAARQESQEKKPAETKKLATIEEQKLRDQVKREEDERLRQERLQIEALLGYARTVPAELAADALLRIADSGKVTDLRWKAELLEEAFRAATSAQHAVKRNALPGSAVETRTGYLSSAFTLNLDRLSLQCRAISALAVVDRPRARRLFAEISGLKLEPLSCEDALVYDVDVFYETAAKVLALTFTPLEIRRNLHMDLARRIIRRMTSPAQVEPAARFLVSLNLTAAQLESLVREYCDALRKISGDSRSFFNRLRALFSAIERLVKASQQKGFDCGDVLEALREYLVNNLKGERCADIYRDPRGIEIEARVIRSWLEELKRYPCVGDKEIPPFTREDYKSEKVEGAARYVNYWRSAKARGILSRLERLRQKSPNRFFSEEEKLDSEWQFRFSQTLNDLAVWGEDDEKSEEDYFHQKCMAYYLLFEVAPEGEAREKILYELIGFLSTSGMQRSAPLEWFSHANRLLYLARVSERAERLRLLEALKQSNNPALYLYAEMELVFTRR